MDQNVLHEVTEKTKALLEAPTCCATAKEAAQRWLAAIGTAAEKQETARYIAEREADIMPIDQLIGFATSEKGAAYFGAETAARIAAHAQEIKAAGAVYCDCPACALVEQILQKKEQMLG